MFKPLVIFGNELLRTDYAGIRKMAGAVSETTDTADFKFFFSLICNHFIIYDLCVKAGEKVSYFRPVNSPQPPAV